MSKGIRQRIGIIRRGEVPEGYRRAETGIVPNDWSNTVFSSVFAARDERTSDADLYLLHSLLIEEGVVPKTDRYERSFLVKGEKDAYKIVMSGDFVYNPMNLRFGAIALYSGSDSVSVSAYYDVFSIKNNFSPKYMEVFLKSPQMVGYYNAMATGSLIEKQRVHFSHFIEFCLPFPSAEEQEKIADAFNRIDRIISLKRQLLEEKCRQKKWLMQNLLDPDSGVRLPGFKGSEWAEKTLEEFCDCLDANRKPVNAKNRKKMQGVYPYYGANNVLDYVSEYLFDEEIVLLAEDGGNFDDFHRKPIALYVNERCWVNNHAHILRAKNGNTKFCFYCLEHKDIRGFVNGTTRSKLTQSDMMSIIIIVPVDETEQTAIANVLSAADREIDLLEQELAEWQTKKKALMQLLLTGIVRV